MPIDAEGAMEQRIIEKLRQGRPVRLAPAEASHVKGALREALAVTLSRPVTDITDQVRVFDDLALDSIDVFDVLDQLAERFEAQVALEELPEALIRGREGLTFDAFAQGIVDYFAPAPAPRPAARER